MSLFGATYKSMDEAAFWYPSFNAISASPALKEELNINDIVDRRGSDGFTSLKQQNGYPWKMFVCLIGESQNTPEGRREIADEIIRYLNEHSHDNGYRYPKNNEFGGDLTPETPRPLDQVLLNANVIEIIKTAFPGHSLKDLSEYDSIVDAFFSDRSAGKICMKMAQGSNDDSNEEDSGHH